MSLTRNIECKPVVGLTVLPVAPGSTFTKGDFLTLDGSGRLQQVISAGANYGSGTTIVGQANENALTSEGVIKGHVGVIPAVVGALFQVPLYHGTPSSAVFNTSLIGQSFELRNTAGGYPAVDISATTNTKVRIVAPTVESYPGFPDTTGAGSTQYPNVWVEFLVASETFEVAI